MALWAWTLLGWFYVMGAVLAVVLAGAGQSARWGDLSRGQTALFVVAWPLVTFVTCLVFLWTEVTE